MAIVCLLNGSVAVRERGSDEVEVLECGCASAPTRWLQMCRPHGTETEELHVRARVEHDTSNLIKELTS